MSSDNDPGPTPGGDGRAAGMLVLACALWGASFTWAKATLAGMAAARGKKPGDLLWLPVLYVAWRFALGAALWAVVFRRSLKGWTWRAARRSAALGCLLAAPMALQQMGLARTSEPVSAFLTSLTIVFTPLALWALFRERPSARIALGVAFGAGGVCLMNLVGRGEIETGTLVGMALGVACALGFALHIVGVDRWGRDEDPFRLSLGQFATASIVALALTPILGAGAADLAPRAQWAMLSGDGVPLNLALATVVSTLGAFGLMFRYQPRVDASRATIIYLTEPVFASAYAWALAERRMTAWEIAGGALILAANFVSRSRKGAAPPEAPACIDDRAAARGGADGP